MNKTFWILVGSLSVLVVSVWLVVSTGNTGKSRNGAAQEPLLMYCAASNRAVVEAIREDYEAECGRSVQIQYGPSQTLLSSLQVSGSGDLYLPADDSFLMIGRDGKLVQEVLPIAHMQAVVAVAKGNPKQIHHFDDLLRDDVRLVQANPDASAIGKLTRNVLQAKELWVKLDAATQGYRTTVNDAANDVLIGAADASIVYDAVLYSYPDLESIKLPELDEAASQVSIGVLSSCRQPAAALHFARYLTARDRGLKEYAAQGFSTQGFGKTGGDLWSDTPELSIFAGSMLRPAIEDTILKFEQREGVQVSRVYNGCGILVAQMKAGQHPDAYFACDSEFMNQVVDLFPEPVPVSQNELVILVEKGNPHKIASLRDLTRDGLRVGIGHEKQCAMGWITQNTFKEGGVQQEIMANVTVQTPTGDMLVNQLRAGSLDAAVAYLSNAAGAAEFLDAIQIQGIECSTATQPWAVATDSKYPLTASRLFAAICSSESQDIFQAEGFRWQLATKPSGQAAESSPDSDKLIDGR